MASARGGVRERLSCFISCGAVADGDGAGDAIGLAQPRRDLLGEGEQLAAEFLPGADAVAEGPLGAHRAVAAAVVDAAGIEVVGEVAQVTAGVGAEVALEVGPSAAGEVADGVDTVVVELRRR